MKSTKVQKIKQGLMAIAFGIYFAIFFPIVFLIAIIYDMMIGITQMMGGKHA